MRFSLVSARFALNFTIQLRLDFFVDFTKSMVIRICVWVFELMRLLNIQVEIANAIHRSMQSTNQFVWRSSTSAGRHSNITYFLPISNTFSLLISSQSNYLGFAWTNRKNGI